MRPIAFGDVTVDKIVEIERLALDPTWLIANAVAEEIEAERPRLGDGLVEAGTGKLVIGVHSYLVRTPKLTMLVDTCCGDHRDRGAASPFHMLETDYLDNLTRAGVEPEAVDLVFCTHLHVDHVGWNVRRREDGRFVPTFPNARYLFSREDFDNRMAVERSDAGAGSPATRAAFRECVLPILEAGLATLVDTDHVVDEEIGASLRLASLPGHCPGHCGLHVAGGSGRGLMTGDAIHHPIQLSRPEWYCSADVDPVASSATRRALVEDYADTDMVLLTGHFPGRTAGRIVSDPKGARFAFL